MRKINWLACLAIVLLSATLMSAQATRTWVSGVGDDANPCSRTAPCKTFAGAISKTAPGGEIDALDPGGFGALTITKSITLDGGGGQVASVLVAGTNGIVVAAGATDVVMIRNLRLDGLLGGGNANAGINGIRWISGKALHIDNCVIFGFAQNGVDIEKSDGGKAFITNTIVQNNGGKGILSLNTTNSVQVTINNVESEDNQWGIFAGDFSKVSVFNSETSGNSTIGMIVQPNAGTSAEMDISNSTSSHNNVGIQSGGAGGTSTMNISNVSGYDNNTSWVIGAVTSSIGSFGNNPILNPGAGLTKNPPAQQ